MEDELKIERASWGWVVGTAIVLVALVAGGAALIAGGHPVWGVVLIVVGAGAAAALYAVARKAVGFFKGGAVELIGDLAAEESYGDQALVSLRESNSNLSEEELEPLLANAKAQMAATRVWFEANAALLEDVSLQSEDGFKLVGHVLACNPGSRRWLIYVHGFGGSWKNGYGYARHFDEVGYNVLFVEMRAQGKSEGDAIGAGWLERRDVVLWAKWLIERAGADTHIVLFGSSMGAASVAMASAEPDLPEQVALSVCDSGYASFWDMMVSMIRAAKVKGMSIPAHPLIDVFRFVFLHTKGGYDLAKAVPADAIARSRVPVMIVQGMADALVGPTNGKRLAAAAGGAAAGEGHDLLEMPSAGHCCSAMANPELYYERVFAFVNRWIEPAD